ncbi:Transmembrane protein of unknown function [Austwickia chelonae]|nr:Transmembrane protein of unknown function [Austwickia chelonae]
MPVSPAKSAGGAAKSAPGPAKPAGGPPQASPGQTKPIPGRGRPAGVPPRQPPPAQPKAGPVKPPPAKPGSGPAPKAAPGPVKPAPASAPGASPALGSAAQQQGGVRQSDARRVKLTLSRIDPFSVLKISFLLSVALGIAGVVAVSVLWGLLSGMGVFSTITDSINELQAGASSNSRIDVSDWFSLGRVAALSVVFGVFNIVMMTAISTLAAVIYNVCAAMVGGVQMTLSDD